MSLSDQVIQLVEDADDYNFVSISVRKVEELSTAILELERIVEDLKDNHIFLKALQAEGVDNWEGYEHALDRLEEEEYES